jgi:hypothetical protein
MANGREYTIVTTPAHCTRALHPRLPGLAVARILADASIRTMSGPPLDALRLVMPDGSAWRVVRRHEMTRIRSRGDSGDRRLYLFFFGDEGGVRRVEVPADFADPATIPAREIVDLWLVSERLS